MTIVGEIQRWSKGLQAWQQDAIARLYFKRELSSNDIDDLYALLKAEHGIPDPKGRVFSKLGDEEVAAPSDANRLVQLVAVKNLRNVNALAEGQRLSIGQSGLTVIYGENGAGKSGYSRVLKRACRARDQREAILPDARKQLEQVGPARAVFEILVNGAPEQVEWNFGKDAPEQLSELAIFDSHCARAYVDNQGDFAYSPYGLDILEGLVKVCWKLREMVDGDRRRIAPNTKPFSSLATTPTKIGNLLSSLSARTQLEDVEVLALLTADDRERLVVLTKALSEVDPKQKAQVLRLRATRFSKLINRIGDSIGLVDDAKVTTLRTVTERWNAAKQAASMAAERFNETSAFLPGTGGDAWKALFDAARQYAIESHPGVAFPHLSPASACPLCQNPLGVEGSARLESFDAFIQQEAEKIAKLARQRALSAFRDIEQANVDLAIDEALANELEAVDSEVAASCLEFEKILTERTKTILMAAAANVEWSTVPLLPPDPRRALEGIAAQLLVEATALEQSSDERARASLVQEHAELDARFRFSELKDATLDAIAALILSERLQACADATSTTAISRKSTELTKTMVTQEVANALNAELHGLNVHELMVAMKPESPGGKAQFKLVLQLPNGGTPASILSEGEQRAIAIASFLTEVTLSKRLGGIVFDDPVSSLDHRRRWHVARRLAAEARRRQVIILTHDTYFLCILRQEAEAAGLDMLTQYLRKTPIGFGVPTDHLPFDTLSTSKRVKRLRQMHDTVASAHRVGDDQENQRLTRETYFHLRLAWERAVEEVLFQDAITRFSEGVSTQKLRYVVVEDADYETINAGMTKSSKFAHDSAAAAHLPTPHPNELRDDIEALEFWRTSVETRKKVVEARRT